MYSIDWIKAAYLLSSVHVVLGKVVRVHGFQIGQDLTLTETEETGSFNGKG